MISDRTSCRSLQKRLDVSLRSPRPTRGKQSVVPKSGCQIPARAEAMPCYHYDADLSGPYTATPSSSPSTHLTRVRLLCPDRFLAVSGRMVGFWGFVVVFRGCVHQKIERGGCGVVGAGKMTPLVMENWRQGAGHGRPKCRSKTVARASARQRGPSRSHDSRLSSSKTVARASARAITAWFLCLGRPAPRACRRTLLQRRVRSIDSGCFRDVTTPFAHSTQDLPRAAGVSTTL